MKEEVGGIGAGLQHDVDVGQIAGQDQGQRGAGRAAGARRAGQRPSRQGMADVVYACPTTGSRALFQARMPPGTLRTSRKPARFSTLAATVER